MQYLVPYLFLINAAALLLMHQDKRNARTRQWRVPEVVLLGLAILGGSLGGTLAMILFRHKTKKTMFSIGMPVILLVHLGLLLLFSQ